MNDIRLVESAISELKDLNRDSRLNLSMRDQIQHLQSGLLFLQLYAQCLAKWNDALQGKKNRDLGSARKSHIKATLAGATKGLYSTGVNALATQDFQQWNDLASDLLRRIQRSKPKIKEDSLYLLNSSFQCRFSSSELQMFFRNLSNSLDEIARLKSRNMVDVLGIKEKLDFFAKNFELARKMRSSNKDFKDFSIRIHSWAYYTACLSLLCRIHDENSEEILPRMRILLSASEVTRMFLAVLRHLWSLSHNRLLMDEGVPKFVDFLLETFHNVPMKDGIRRNLRSNLIFLTTFLVDPPTTEEYRKDAGSIARDVHDIICPTNAIEIQGGTDEDFQGKLEAAKGKVGELYALIFADSTSFDFPKINVSGFLDSLIHNMREISDSMPDHDTDFKMLGEDLLSLGSFLNDISRKNIDLWRQIVNLVYRVEIAVNMSSYLNDCVWYDKKLLSNIREEINIVKAEVKKLKNDQFHDIKVPNVEMSSLSVRVNNKPITDDDIVGFKDDSSIIVDKLLNRTEGLMMVSIVGMAGQGKTTLANMVSCHPSVYSHFHKRMWCVVSQTFQRKRLLLDILNDLGTYLDSSNMAEEALEQLLRKSLKQRRYLIVMDDVWDAKAWDDLKLSFPDDGTGSRILLTTRNHNVLNGISDSMPTSIHELSALSHSESLDLLRRRLFGMTGDFPDPDFAAVGKQIAGNCNGLPKAIIVIADLLKEKVDCFDWWKQMAESLDYQIASRGGIDSVELS